MYVVAMDKVSDWWTGEHSSQHTTLLALDPADEQFVLTDVLV